MIWYRFYNVPPHCGNDFTNFLFLTSTMFPLSGSMRATRDGLSGIATINVMSLRLGYLTKNLCKNYPVSR